MAAVLDFTKKGEPGSKRKTYFRMKLAELLTGVAIQDNYVSREMKEGLEREPLARAAYETQEGVMVEQIGFAMHDTIARYGCSPDGLIGDKGGLELKSPKAGTHLQWIMDGVIPEEHLPQVRSGLSVTKREWWDFASFNPEVPKPLRLMVIRLTRAEANLEPLEQAVQQFNQEINEAVKRLRKIAGPFELPAAQRDEEPQRQASALDGYLTDEDFEGLIK